MSLQFHSIIIVQIHFIHHTLSLYGFCIYGTERKPLPTPFQPLLFKFWKSFWCLFRHFYRLLGFHHVILKSLCQSFTHTVLQKKGSVSVVFQYVIPWMAFYLFLQHFRHFVVGLLPIHCFPSSVVYLHEFP